MPLINSTYVPPKFFSSGHVQTIYASMFRKLENPKYNRERIETADGDFIDLDWSKIGSKKLVIISHGLEGSSDRPYIVGMSRALNKNGFDTLAWNFRSCSGEINKSLRFYHSGSIDDLHAVIEHSSQLGMYDSISLVGFSMGGNITLKYLGDIDDNRIEKAVVFSVPCDLGASAEELSKKINWLYMKRFLLKLSKKLEAKQKLYPNEISLEGFNKVKNFKQYDDIYTAPIHGFRDAKDYWDKCSSLYSLSNIKTPVLLVNSLDDPFLAGKCYPYEEAKNSEYLYFETPKYGGHVGFIDDSNDNIYWSEQRTIDFFMSYGG